MDPVRRSYDAVARRYAAELSGELAAKPIDRALYRMFADLVRADRLGGRDEVGGEAPVVGDVGCGIGHITSYLAGLGLRPVGVDPSPRMLEVARQRYPDLDFALGSYTGLPVADAAWAGAVGPYSIIHVPPGERPAAWAELSRAIRPGGLLLVAFHIESATQVPGSVRHLDEWWGIPVDLDFHFIDPAHVTVELAAAGFDLLARTDREPAPGIEFPTRRSYLLVRHR